jgi:shikimate dehydrogenase
VKCAVLGDPISHSLSPVLHSAGYAELGLAWEYTSCQVASGGLGGFLSGLDDTWRGLSLTMPLKREAMALADRVTDTARAAHAANTLVLVGREVHADNTDVPGAAAALRERYDGPVDRVTVLGGGATAASTALALCGLGARSVTLLVRSPERAAATAAVVAAHASRPDVRIGWLDDVVVAADVLVSTIPAAAQDEALVARCADLPVVFDVVYDPWPTPLAASAAGRVLVAGLDLLVHQAAMQFTEFTGLPAPLDTMRAAGESGLAARQVGT